MTSSAPIIGVYFTKPNYEDSPFNREEFVCSYHELGLEVTSLGGTLALVRSMETFRGGNRFHGGWIFDGKKFERTDEMIDAGVVFNKGEDFTGDGQTNLVNDPELHALCEKDRTYRLFSEYCPQSVIVTSPSELEGAFCGLLSERFICKPTALCGGKGIVIGTKEEILASKHQYPLLLQEFLDLSGGIPGVMDGLHDLRMVFIGDRFSYAMVRTPPPGGLTANITQGGSFFTVPDEKIPVEAMSIARAVDERLQSFKTRIYSVDLGRNADGRWYVLELNSPPGLFPSRGDRIMDRDHRMLAEHLLRIAKQEWQQGKETVSESMDAASSQMIRS